MNRYYDISVKLGVESIDYPGDTQYSRDQILTFDQGGICDLSSLKMSPHSGTHIDAPAHFIPRGKTIDDYAVDAFIRPAHVVEIRDPEAVRPWELENLETRPDEALLFKTENSKIGLCATGRFSEEYVYVSAEAAEFCVRRKSGLVGLDYITIDRFGDDLFPAHRVLLGNGVLILEGINLVDVPPGRYTLLCLPLKIRGAEASPVRAVLLSSG